jgi:aminobenzoyl-glutamate utilization protein B
VIAVHVEYDAVPSGSQTPGATEHEPVVAGAPGHAEGHNTNAALWIGAAYAVKQAMDEHHLAGTIKLFSAPAEEQGISRPYFVRDGYFKDVDAAFHAHVGSDLSTSYGPRQYAVMSVEYEFFGKTAHAAVAPWTGKSAGDAVKLMDIGWDVLREHLPPTARTHSTIVDAGVQPNVVPDYGKIWFYFREATYEGAKALYEKAHDVAQGAALMTGTTWKEHVLSACWPTRDNRTLAEVVQSNIELAGAKVMAGSIVDVLTNPDVLAKAKATFAEEVAGSTYRSLLPPDQKPPVDLNAAEMAKFREAMTAHYLTGEIHFR